MASSKSTSIRRDHSFDVPATPERTFLKKDNVIFSKLQLVFVFVFIRKVAVKDNLQRTKIKLVAEDPCNGL